MTDLYRGYEIKAHPNGGFYWTDERGFDHTATIATTTRAAADKGFASEDAVMDNIDQYKRNMREATA